MLSALKVESQQFNLLIGTYTGNGSKGIYTYNFNAETGKATWKSNTDNNVTNPSFLAVSDNNKFVYAVNETHGNDPGSVSSFALDAKTGKLTFLNKQFTGGDDPCYVTVDKSNHWVLVANYSGGSVSALPVDTDGSLKPLAQLVQHHGKSVNFKRQQQPHVHQAILSPKQEYLFTPDLGTDKIMTYAFNATSNQPLAPATIPFVSVTAGNGPRHLAFHPNNKWAYLVEEMGGSITAFTYHNGKLQPFQHILTHPNDYEGAIGSADIHISPDGKFLYASNRGDQHNIAIFAINDHTGSLQLKGYEPVQGSVPRNFVIDPSGNYLLVANQQSNNIVIFNRDKITGLLSPTGNQIQVPNPVCLIMVK